MAPPMSSFCWFQNGMIHRWKMKRLLLKSESQLEVLPMSLVRNILNPVIYSNYRNLGLIDSY